jgi:hypothetical protein
VIEAQLAALAVAVRSGDFYLSKHYERDRLIDPLRPRTTEIVVGIGSGDTSLVEDYPNHPYGPAMLVRGEVNGRAIHVECSYPPRDVIIVTAYWPDTEPDEWNDDYTERRAP